MSAAERADGNDLTADAARRRAPRRETGDGRRSETGAAAVVTTTAERYVMSGGQAAHLVVKEGDLFLYTDALGQASGGENSELGLYRQDTRFLSRLELTVAGRKPVLLSSTAERGYAATIELTNLESRAPDGRVLPQASLHLRRTRFIDDGLREQLRVRNFHSSDVELLVDLHFDADYADLFEVRGLRRRRRGARMQDRCDARSLTLAYRGLDDVVRETRISFDEPPESLKQGRARFRLRLAPGEMTTFGYDVTVHTVPAESRSRRAEVGAAAGTAPVAGAAPEAAASAAVQGAPDHAGPAADAPREPQARLAALRHEHERWDSGATDIFTDNEEVNRVLRRGQADLRMLSAQLGSARIPFSGLPWFAAPFGRELVFVGLETLLLDLRWARGAADFLEARQGRSESVFRDEQPGKILHELRRGELAALKAIPHTPCFGSIDATPLWLLLVAELTMWTGDLDGFEARRDAVDAALAWIDTYGDQDGDGFVEYTRRSRAGLLNQGWRDAGDAVLFADGTRAEGSIALAETQGYVYYAKRRLAAIFGELGDVERAEELSGQAGALKRAFNERFWMEDEGFFAMALDGRKEQVTGICSTIGHALWTRIVGDDHVDAVVRRLMAPDMYTGWGVRTFSKQMKGYNPVSFYNGSVWPFDTAVIANGMKKHGYAQESNRLAWGLVEAAGAHEYERLPEMFCGFTRRAINKPVAFPMACSPDASSAGALFLILQSTLGIYAQADENIVYVHDPDLPKWLGEVTLTNLKVGRTSMRLRFRREGTQTSFAVLDKQGPGRIVVVE